MKKYNINKISAYFSILEENDISSYIYRGQNEPYFSIGASGFRPYQGGWNSDKIYDMEYLRSIFYNRIIGQISESEKKHFLAFCQHHGIPTNLVDMSFSPLVALLPSSLN
ncbi:FRG domain-containing protein [Amphibacillus sediminis]|uniref:FRG domain-containing protein n=1 Tax=Amphibacillus sediminis TaxID=360185 RepID=UPI0008319927|nr:FRG domain-containing protein [Amphibacillus sediminis]